MKKEKVSCPECGTKVRIDGNEFTAIAAVSAPKKPAKKTKSAQERIEALRNLGVDVGNLFALRGSHGGEYVASNKDGQLTILHDDDPIFQDIARQGAVPNRCLFRRWIVAQMFHMLTHIPYGKTEPAGVTKMIHRLGYEYQWRMLINELHAQMKMEKKDPENFADRNRWFNAGLVRTMAKDYIEQLKIRVDAMPERRCKYIPYKRIAGRDIFVSDLQYKLYRPFHKAIGDISRAKNATQLYNAAKQFNDLRIKMAWNTPQSKVWVDAYKGAGAFFTIQNLIRFHDCVLFDDAGKRLDKFQSQAFLSVKAEMYKDGQGWCLLSVMKKMLEDNNININQKMAEWRRN